jgi:LmbE family N-acetylglucosaminyl deacetylase
MNRILIVVAHPDDEILGIGGTIKRMTNEGQKVNVLILGEGLMARDGSADENDLEQLKQCSRNAAKILGIEKVYFSNLPDNMFDSIPLLKIIKEVERHINIVNPNIVYTHHYGDLNIDHQITFNAVTTAIRPLKDSIIEEVYTFETPSSTEWNLKTEKTFQPNVFVDINDTIKFKLDAMECYHTELKEYPHPRSIKALKIIANSWGINIGKEYVEAFRLIRKII